MSTCSGWINEHICTNERRNSVMSSHCTHMHWVECSYFWLDCDGRRHASNHNRWQRESNYYFHRNHVNSPSRVHYQTSALYHNSRIARNSQKYFHKMKQTFCTQQNIFSKNFRWVVSLFEPISYFLYRKKRFFLLFSPAPIGNKCNVIVFELCLAELSHTMHITSARPEKLNNSECFNEILLSAVKHSHFPPSLRQFP